jgi:hypothetical protein
MKLEFDIFLSKPRLIWRQHVLLRKGPLVTSLLFTLSHLCRDIARPCLLFFDLSPAPYFSYTRTLRRKSLGNADSAMAHCYPTPNSMASTRLVRRQVAFQQSVVR